MISALAKVALRSPGRWLHLAYRFVLLAWVAWLSAGALRLVWHFTIDDSGISFAYAKHLAQGHGPVAAPGGPWVEGYSNAAWVFAMIPLHWLGLPIPETSKWLGVLALIAMLGTGFWLLAKDYGWRLALGALGALWVVLVGVSLETVVWTVAGLENALLGALLVALAALDRAERDRPERFAWSALVAFGICITRPEGILYAAPVIALRVWDAWRRVELRTSAQRLVLTFGGALLVYHAVHYSVFREWVPNTYYAKPRGRSLTAGIDYLTKNLKDSGLRYLVPLALLGCAGRIRDKAALIGFCGAGVFFILYSGGDWMPHSRFVNFFAAPLLLLGVHGVYNLGAFAERLALRRSVVRRVPEDPVRGRWFVEAVAGVSVLLAVFLWDGYHAPRVAKAAKAKFCHFCQRSADARKLQKVSKDANLGRITVLTHDFGGPAWVSDDKFYPMDFLGLCDATVARIRRTQDHLWLNTLLSPYLFHEQPHAPSWIYLPSNFWRHLKELPEFRADYYTLSSRLLPHAPGGSYLALHKSHLVDYFPPLVRDVQPQVLSETLGLVGAAWFTDQSQPTTVDAGKNAHVVLSVLPRGPSRGSESVWVEISGGKKTSKTKPRALTRGLSGMDSQLGKGEPLRLDFTLKLPELSHAEGASQTFILKVGVQNSKRARDQLPAAEVARLTPGAALPIYERLTTRYPSALPRPTHSELQSLRQAVIRAAELSYGAAHEPTGEEVALAERLRALGDSLVSMAPDQAYLAYVWATWLDPRQWEHVTQPLLGLRRPIDDARYAWERALLNDFYSSLFGEGQRAPDTASGHETAARRRLVAFYEQSGDPHRATYFRNTVGHTAESPADSSADSSAHRTPAWTELFTFEEPKSGWTGDLDVFGEEHPDPAGWMKHRGLVGRGWLSSRRDRDRGRGAVVSPTFTLNGARLSFLFAGGGKSDVGVELIVDGSSVRTTDAGFESVFQPVWWDIEAFTGKSAQLRVYDKSARRSVYVDQVVLWK